MVLAMVNIVIFGNLKVCLMQGLILLLHLIIVLHSITPELSYYDSKIGVKFNGTR